MNLCYHDTAITKTVDRCPLLNWAGTAQQGPSAWNNCCTCCSEGEVVRALLSLQEKSARSGQATSSEPCELWPSRAGRIHTTSSAAELWASWLLAERQQVFLSSGTAACKTRRDNTTEAQQQKQKCRLYKHNVWWLKSPSSGTTTFATPSAVTELHSSSVSLTVTATKTNVCLSLCAPLCKDCVGSLLF